MRHSFAAKEASNLFADALRQPDIEAAEELLSKHPGIERYSDGAMICAVYGGCREVIKLLMNRGLSINQEDKAGKNPLISVLNYCNSSNPWVLERASLLLEMGADPNVREYRGIMAPTALHCVVKQKHTSTTTETVHQLVKYGADIHAPAGRFQRPPLFFAIMARQAATVRSLLALGARPDLRIDGLNAHEFATTKGRHEIADEIQAWHTASVAQRVITDVVGKTDHELKHLPG